MLSGDEIQRLFDQAPDGYWLVNLHGRTEGNNAAMARMLGTSDDVLARGTIFDYVDSSVGELFAAHVERMQAQGEEQDEYECLFHRADGTQLWALVRESLWLSDSGEVRGVAYRCTEFKHRHQLERAMAEGRKQASAAQRMARVAGWTWNIADGSFDVTDEWAELVGLEEDQTPRTIDEVLAMVHPDDQAEVYSQFEAIKAGEEFTEFTTRFGLGGCYLWSRVRGEVQRGANNEPIQVIGIHQDVSELKQHEEELTLNALQQEFLQSFASAANRARTLEDLYRDGTALLHKHMDWRRSRVWTVEEGRLVPLNALFEEIDEDSRYPQAALRLRRVAERALKTGEITWSAESDIVSGVIRADDEIAAVVAHETAVPLADKAGVNAGFNAMLQQSSRVVERERLERSLNAARDDAMAASRQKSQFLATMSHEIRTPLNGVIGLSDLLSRKKLDPEHHRLVEGIRAASQSLLSVINDVLDFSKIEAGHLKTEAIGFDPCTVIEQVEHVVQTEAGEKGLTFVTSCTAERGTIMLGDPTRIVQVLTNLTSNAVKFTPSGEVRLEIDFESLTDEAIRVKFTVSDTGIGIDPEALPSLLKPFTQADPSTTREFGGTGLGLAISHEIVRALGGELEYRRNEPHGSVFSFELILSTLNDGTDEFSSVADLSGVDVNAVAAEDSPRVLVVEDNVVNQEVTCGLLSALGYRFEVAEDGQACLDKLTGKQFDAVLMDVQMPVMDGREASRALRESRSINRTVPVIAMTAAALPGERELCLEAGMDDFLSKPVSIGTLAAMLRDWAGPPHRVSGDAAEQVARHVPAPSQPIPGLDTERLDMLRDLEIGNTHYIDRAISNFLERAPGQLFTISENAQSRSLHKVKTESHKLTGSASNLGLLDAAEAASAIEVAVTTDAPDDLGPLVEALDEALTKSSWGLRLYRARLHPEDSSGDSH